MQSQLPDVLSVSWTPARTAHSGSLRRRKSSSWPAGLVRLHEVTTFRFIPVRRRLILSVSGSGIVHVLTRRRLEALPDTVWILKRTVGSVKSAGVWRVWMSVYTTPASMDVSIAMPREVRKMPGISMSSTTRIRRFWWGMCGAMRWLRNGCLRRAGISRYRCLTCPGCLQDFRYWVSWTSGYDSGVHKYVCARVLFICKRIKFLRSKN